MPLTRLVMVEAKVVGNRQVNLASLKERRKKRRRRMSVFDCVWFSRKTAILDSILVVFHM